MTAIRKALRICALLALVGVGVAIPTLPANAGGWAATVLDPLPERFEADRSYTIGYWVLQHGSHPYEGDLGFTGLRLAGPNSEQLTFEGVALPEPAHYAVALALPTDGQWQVYALQGVFQEQNLGTLTVPGGLALLPPDGKVAPGQHSHTGQASPWGAVHPPDSAGGHGHDHAAAPQQAIENVVAAAPQPAQPGQRSTMPALLGFGSVIVLLGLLVGARQRRRRLQG